MQYLFFLGSHPDISASEAFSVLEQQGYQPQVLSITRRSMHLEVSQALPADFLSRLGGTERIAKIIAQSPTLWEPTALWEILSANNTAAKKFRLGLSGINVPATSLKELGHAVKDLARAAGTSIRFVTTTKARQGEARLNAAQVHFNRLIESPNIELTLLDTDSGFIAAQTTHSQDIVAYEQRDTKRPARDAKIGMLPPKLAQIMLNLTTSQLPGTAPYMLYDPFCGTGTILQEGWLHDDILLGSDSNPTMITASNANLDWMAQFYDFVTPRPTLWQHDVQQPFPKHLNNTLDAIVTEPYLGRPLSKPLLARETPRHIEHLAELYLSFFRHAYPLLKPEGLILLLLPAFRKGSRKNDTFTLFPAGFLDAIATYGYSMRTLIPEALEAHFSPSPRGSLLYARPDALVGRELTLWQKHST